LLQQMGFLWAVAAVVWVGILYYVVMLLRRQTRLTKEVEQVSLLLQELAAAAEVHQDND
jgi:CcmD family protein